MVSEAFLKLKEKILKLRKECADRGDKMFLDIPERWYDGKKFRCANNHISTCILKTDSGDRCLECQEHLLITFPEDEEGPLG